MSLHSSSICSDEELLEELKKLGYEDVSEDVFNVMKDDLVQLVEKDQGCSTFRSNNPYPDSYKHLSTIDAENSTQHSMPRKTKKNSYGRTFSSVDEDRYVSEDVFNVRKDDLVQLAENDQGYSTVRNNNSYPDSYKHLSTIDTESSTQHTMPRKTKKNTYGRTFSSVNEDRYVSQESTRTDSLDYTPKIKSTSSVSLKQAKTKCRNTSLSPEKSLYSYNGLRDSNSNTSINSVADYNHNSSMKLNGISEENRFRSNHTSNSNRFKSKTVNKQESKTVGDNFSTTVTDSCSLPSIKIKFNTDKNSNLNLTSLTSSEVKTMKRKVLRRRNGQSVITEEFLEVPRLFDTSYPESRSYSNNKSFSSDDLSPKSNSSTGSVSLVSSESSLKSSSTNLSLISTSTSLRSLNLRKKKHDPVAMYNYYKKFWDNFKPPGEKTHNKLRWAVRDRMLDYDI